MLPELRTLIEKLLNTWGARVQSFQLSLARPAPQQLVATEFIGESPKIRGTIPGVPHDKDYGIL